jgi:hypothetical protein
MTNKKSEETDEKPHLLNRRLLAFLHETGRGPEAARVLREGAKEGPFAETFAALTALEAALEAGDKKKKSSASAQPSPQPAEPSPGGRWRLLDEDNAAWLPDSISVNAVLRVFLKLLETKHRTPKKASPTKPAAKKRPR